MKRIVASCIALVASVLFAAAQPAKEPYAPGLGEFMTATQLRHAKLWFAGKEKSWDLAAYEIDEIMEGLEDAEKQFPTRDGIPVADMIKANIDPAVEELRRAVEAKSGTKFAVAFDKLASACNTRGEQAVHSHPASDFVPIEQSKICAMKVTGTVRRAVLS
jgi:hypothetical protein